MKNIFAKPENVLTLCGLALADMALLMSVPQYVPTLHLAKTSFWNGTRINQIRFGSFPDTGLAELARAEAARHAETWDAWAFACIALQPGDSEKPVLLVDGGKRRSQTTFVSSRNSACPTTVLACTADRVSA